MALIVKDRVQQTSTTTGTGTLTLSGTVSGFQTFSSAIGNTNTTYYAIVNDAEWEVGIGTVSAGALSRDTVLESSNGGSLVNFTAGTKYVFCTYPAEKSVYKDETDKVTGYVIENSSIGATTPSTGRFTDLTDTGLTSGRVTYASTGGNLVDSANLTFNGTTLTTTAVVTPSVTAPTTDLTLSAISTGVVNVNTAGGTQFRVANVNSAVNYVQAYGSVAGGAVSIESAGTDANIWLNYFAKGTGNHQFLTNNAVQMRIAHTASAVNYVQVTGGATTVTPVISSQGSDSNVDLTLRTKGSGVFRFENVNGGSGFRVSAPVGASTQYLQATGSASAFAPQFQSQGTDTNIALALQSKGTGAIDLAAGSSGVNISNGGTVTAITGTNIGSSYTSFPSVVISAPTTAGGVQATASVVGMISNNPVTIASGGTGYTVGDTLTVVGGTSISGAATLTVNSVSGGVITAVFNLNFAGYTVLPTNPVSVTGGTGSGATFNLTYSLRSASGFTITNAGSGYIEQPTVTFSGGGGSGAAAYATVGSATIFRSLAGAGNSAQSLSFHSSSGESLRVTTSTTGGTSANFLQVAGGALGNGPRLTAEGSETNIFMGLVTKGTGAFQFLTNIGSEQLRVAHTASAVNFVQVTGATTGNRPVIQVAGSDTNIGLTYGAKGSALHAFSNGEGTQFAINTTGATIANRLNVAASAAGQAPSFSVSGTDTNINLTLTPKGTGRVQFGTYTGTVSSIAGYIEILDAGGTVRRLAVVS